MLVTFFTEVNTHIDTQLKLMILPTKRHGRLFIKLFDNVPGNAFDRIPERITDDSMVIIVEYRIIPNTNGNKPTNTVPTIITSRCIKDVTVSE